MSLKDPSSRDRMILGWIVKLAELVSSVVTSRAVMSYGPVATAGTVTLTEYPPVSFAVVAARNMRPIK